MASCNELKKGEVYGCESCGVEFEVKKECNCPEHDCTPASHNHCCDFVCCGKPMVKK